MPWQESCCTCQSFTAVLELPTATLSAKDCFENFSGKQRERMILLLPDAKLRTGQWEEHSSSEKIPQAVRGRGTETSMSSCTQE